MSSIMTDKELELIFNSILNFCEFISKVEACEEIALKNNIKISFNSNSKIIVSIDEKDFNLSLEAFNKILHEFIIEKNNNGQHALDITETQYTDKIRNEIFKIDSNTFKVHKEYIEKMYSSQDVASTHSLYIKNLTQLIRLIKNGMILQIEDVQIKRNVELIEYLELFGFEFIKQDLDRLEI